MATASRRTARSASKNGASSNGKSKAKTTKTSTNVTPQKLADTLIAAAQKKFGVKLDTREERIGKKVGYATRERLGKNLLGLAKDDFSWDTWNKIFAKIFGEPTNLKYSPEIVAQAMAIIYHDVPTEPEAAVQALIEYNDRSLEERNRREREERENDDLNDIEELLDDDEDESDEEDLDFVDEADDEDLEDFDEDELDDFDEE
ncbi:MAG: hypothetical protein QNJ72_06150 [Pleurocapsa sp. MO_226.B13]|nr:hypothetical protein [Pleurocapsa sp. MO_226.B13]